MIVVMRAGATEGQIQAVVENLSIHGFDVHRSSGQRHTVLGAIGLKPEFDHRAIAVLDGVDTVQRVTPDGSSPSRPAVDVGPVRIGGGSTVVFARLPSTVTPKRVANLLQAHRRITGIVLGTGHGSDTARLGRLAEVARAAGACFIVDPLPTTFASTPSFDGMILRGAATASDDRLDRAASASPVLLLSGTSRGTAGWQRAAIRISENGDSPVFVLTAPKGSSNISLSILSRLVASGLAPVLADLSRNPNPRTADVLAAVAGGASGVVVFAGIRNEDDRRVALGLAETAAVASAVGRPLLAR